MAGDGDEQRPVGVDPALDVVEGDGGGGRIVGAHLDLAVVVPGVTERPTDGLQPLVAPGPEVILDVGHALGGEGAGARRVEAALGVGILADGIVGEAVLADVAAVVGVDHGHAGDLAVVVVVLADAVGVRVGHVPGGVARLGVVAADVEQEGVLVLHLPGDAQRLLGGGRGRAHRAQIHGGDGQRRRPRTGLTALRQHAHAPVVETGRQHAGVVIVGIGRDGVDDGYVEAGLARQLEAIAGGMGHDAPADDDVGGINAVAGHGAAEGGQRHGVQAPRRQLAGAVDGPRVGDTGITAGRLVGQQMQAVVGRGHVAARRGVFEIGAGIPQPRGHGVAGTLRRAAPGDEVAQRGG